jgi:hypothetical protein
MKVKSEIVGYCTLLKMTSQEAKPNLVLQGKNQLSRPHTPAPSPKLGEKGSRIQVPLPFWERDLG